MSSSSDLKIKLDDEELIRRNTKGVLFITAKRHLPLACFTYGGKYHRVERVVYRDDKRRWHVVVRCGAHHQFSSRNWPEMRAKVDDEEKLCRRCFRHRSIIIRPKRERVERATEW